MTTGTKRYRQRRRKPARVREGPREPVWITLAMLQAIHSAQLQEHGGARGVRDVGLLQSALSRARNKQAYGERDVCVLAAAYGFGIVRNHAFVDGNKRTAFVAAAVFLALNGVEIDAAETEVVGALTRLAAGKLSENAFANWLRAHITREPPSR